MGITDGPILAVSGGAKFMDFWDDVGDPS